VFAFVIKYDIKYLQVFAIPSRNLIISIFVLNKNKFKFNLESQRSYPDEPLRYSHEYR